MHTRKGATERHRPAQGESGRELEQFRATFRDATYYSTGRDWSDYAPAYRYGRAAFHHHRGERFGEVEPRLADHWEEVRAGSRLAWTEARGAVEHAWECAEQEAPKSAPGLARREGH
jgi:hypothetical protein